MTSKSHTHPAPLALEIEVAYGSGTLRPESPPVPLQSLPARAARLVHRQLKLLPLELAVGCVPKAPRNDYFERRGIDRDEAEVEEGV